MNVYARWRALLDMRQAERTEDRVQADRVQQRQLEAELLGHAPYGLELRLEHTDWLDILGRDAAPRLDFRLTSIHGPVDYRDDVGWVRVWGHTHGCGMQPDHGPCVTATVRVGAIIDAMAPPR